MNKKQAMEGQKVVEKLNDSELNSVTGGFIETQGYAAAYNIICPWCRKSEAENFTWWQDTTYKQNGYTCANCKRNFWVDVNGNYTDENNTTIVFAPAP